MLEAVVTRRASILVSLVTAAVSSASGFWCIGRSLGEAPLASWAAYATHSNNFRKHLRQVPECFPLLLFNLVTASGCLPSRYLAILLRLGWFREFSKEYCVYVIGYQQKSEHLWHNAHPSSELLFIYIYLSTYLQFLNGIKRTYIHILTYNILILYTI